jgi:hypothetical protein
MISYAVTFHPGVYKVSRNPVNPHAWVIGREDTGRTVGFAFEENDAKHICLGLNVVHAQVTGNREYELELMRELEKLKGH